MTRVNKPPDDDRSIQNKRNKIKKIKKNSVLCVRNEMLPGILRFKAKQILKIVICWQLCYIESNESAKIPNTFSSHSVR